MKTGAFAVEYHPAARAEVRQALRWYEERNALAALLFLREFDETIQRMADGPARWSPYLYGTRRCLVHEFPYGVIYRVRGKLGQVIAARTFSSPPRSRARLDEVKGLDVIVLLDVEPAGRLQPGRKPSLNEND